MTEPATVQDEFCDGCRHSLGLHYRDVKGIARCMVVSRGVSTRGILGLPWEQGCPCVEFKIPTPQPETADEHQNRIIRRLVESALKSLPPKTSGHS